MFKSSLDNNIIMDIKKLLIADIHLHLDGSLQSHAVIKIAKKENIVLPTYVEKELDKYLMVDENCASLNESIVATLFLKVVAFTSSNWSDYISLNYMIKVRYFLYQ